MSLKSSARSLLLERVNRLLDTASDAEASLYAPVKDFLERRGYEVKGEVRGCDLVAVRADEPPVIVELKRRFSLALVLQGIDRLALSDRVYLAVPRPEPRRAPGPDRAEVRRLCRRLGLGLILVDCGRRRVDILEEPLPYRPRRAPQRTLRLAEEFARRVGDANTGGVVGVPIVTAYRQDALRCLRTLAASGPMRVAALRAAAEVPAAARIMQRNVYGWFARTGRGTYALTDGGRAALARFAEALAALPVPA
jgi:hypothetical protein